MQVSSGNVHRNGNIAGNNDNVSQNQSEVLSRKRLSEEAVDACGKKRRVDDTQEQVSSTHCLQIHTIQEKEHFILYV